MEQKSYWYGITGAINDIILQDTYTSFNFVGYAGTRLKLGDVTTEQSMNGRNISLTIWTNFMYHTPESVLANLKNLINVPTGSISEQTLRMMIGRSSNWANTIVELAEATEKDLNKAAIAMMEKATRKLVSVTRTALDDAGSLSRAAVVLIRCAIINQITSDRYEVKYVPAESKNYGIDLVNASVFHFKQDKERSYLTDEPLGRRILSGLISALRRQRRLKDSVLFHASVLDSCSANLTGTAYFNNLVTACLLLAGTMGKLATVAVSKNDPDGEHKEKYEWIAKMKFNDNRPRSSYKSYKQYIRDLGLDVTTKQKKNCLVLPDKQFEPDIFWVCKIQNSYRV